MIKMLKLVYLCIMPVFAVYIKPFDWDEQFFIQQNEYNDMENKECIEHGYEYYVEYEEFYSYSDADSYQKFDYYEKHDEIIESYGDADDEYYEDCEEIIECYDE